MSNPRIQTFIDVDQAAKDVEINQIADVIDNDEFIRQPGRVFYYTAAAAKAERQVSKIKLQLEMAEAQADTRIRDEARQAGEKMTADAVKAAIRQDKTVTRLDIDLLDAQEVLATIKGVVSALSHKKDMLVMRGHMTRDEIKARLSVEGDLKTDANASVQSRHDQVRQRLASQ